ncbi:MAG: SatD family protein [Methanolobus sp.]
MTGKSKLCAVITGDIVKSSEFDYAARNQLIDYLHSSFNLIEKQLELGSSILLPFEIYRGDSFQVVLSSPERALISSVLLSLRLMLFYSGKKPVNSRISIGIGTIDYIPESGNIGEADGLAFRLSGKNLDKMKQRGQKLLVSTQNPSLNLMFESQCAFFDFLADRWTPVQKEILSGKLSGLTQEEIAYKQGKSQSSISQSLKSAGFNVIKTFVGNYEELFKEQGIFVRGDE